MSEEPGRHKPASLSLRVHGWMANSPVSILFWTVVFALMGIGCLWVGFGEPKASDRVGLLAMGGLFLALVWANLLRMSGNRRGQLVPGELDGQPAAVITMSSVGPIAMLVFCGALGALFVGVGLDNEDAGGRRFFLVLGGAFLVLGADGVRALLRRARLAFTADVLDYRGWDYEARLPWSDVIGADPVREKRREFVRVFGRSSDHYVYRKVWRLARMELRPNPPHINTASQALRPSEPYAHLLQKCAVSTREERADLIRSLSGPTSGSLREQVPDA